MERPNKSGAHVHVAVTHYSFHTNTIERWEISRFDGSMIKT